MADTPAGWKRYEGYLGWQATEGPVGRNKAYVSLSKGWALGSKEFKAGLVKDHALAADTRAWETVGAREIREQQWEECLAHCLRGAGKTPAKARADRKAAEWKIVIADELKRTTQATNGWIAERLNMGSGTAVSQYVGLWRRKAGDTKSQKL